MTTKEKLFLFTAFTFALLTLGMMWVLIYVTAKTV